MGVDGQRDEDHVAVEEVAEEGVANCNDTCSWVGFVVASEFLLFILLEM